MQVSLLPVGPLPPQTLERLAAALAERGFVPRVLPEMEPPEKAYVRERDQWSAEPFLEMARSAPGDRVLVVTDLDLFAPGLNFVFGLADTPGHEAVISTARLHDADPERFHERVLKEAMHELGHTLGLRHCPNPRCVLHFSNTLADTDRKSADLCPRCQRRLGAAPGG